MSAESENPPSSDGQEPLPPHSESPDDPSLTDISGLRDVTNDDLLDTLELSGFPSCEYASVTSAKNGTATVTFKENRICDEGNVDALGDMLSALVETYGFTDITIDFAQVDHYSSSAIGKLIRLDKKIRTCGREQGEEGKVAVVHLINVKPSSAEVFHITKLDQLFDVQEQKDEAPPAYLPASRQAQAVSSTTLHAS
ncbi:MAG: STAS domain-containing protein [Candidatus Peribacteraceae bacterium]|jgi:anti-sigma B factor antagonist